MKKMLLAGIMLALLAGCSANTQKATRVLESQGYTNVHLTGYKWFFSGCSKEDEFNSAFTATGVNGHQVSGVVCDGIFKGMTVRFE